MLKLKEKQKILSHDIEIDRGFFFFYYYYEIEINVCPACGSLTTHVINFNFTCFCLSKVEC